jgi:2-polyprenyl-3-methyl-5-hydroxy-6-metoxy-1,4-benzoquinol methylase
MRPVVPAAGWPPSWELSYHYDRMELYGENPRSGYVYAYDARRRATLDLVRRAAGPGAAVLDVAAAQGNFALALAELGYEVTWNDLRAELVDYVRLKHERGTIHYAPGNIFELAFPRLFDVVLVTEVIEHVAHPDEFLRKVAALARPGGHIVLTTPNGAYFRNRLPRFSDCPDPALFESRQFLPDSDGHIFLLHEDEIRRFAAAAGLAVVELRLTTNFFTQGHLKTGKLLPFIPARAVQTLEGLSQALPAQLRSKLHTSFAALLRRS